MKDICYAICPISEKPVLVLAEPIQGLNLNLFKNTYWEQEYRFWYQRVVKLKDEIDFKIIDRVEESQLEEKIKFHSERLSQLGNEIINSNSHPFREKIYEEVINAINSFDNNLFTILGDKNGQGDSLLYIEEIEYTSHILSLLGEVLIRSYPKIEPATEVRFRIKLVYYTIILKRFFGFSEEELSDILFKRNLNILEFQEDMKIPSSRYLDEDFYEEMNLDWLNENYSYVHHIIRSEKFVINFLRSQLDNQTCTFKSISSVKFFLINSFKELSIERDMFDLIHYILNRFNLVIYSDFKNFCVHSIILDRQSNNDYHLLIDIWSILERRFSHYISSDPYVGKARKARYDSINEIGFFYKRIKKDKNSFLRKFQDRPKLTETIYYRNR